MSRACRFPWMVVAWVAMGATVTAGFYGFAREDRERCHDSNQFRTEDLPRAFDSFGRFLGTELGASPAEVEDALRRFQVVLADDLPPREC